jgi:serine/threonine protein kinase
MIGKNLEYYNIVKLIARNDISDLYQAIDMKHDRDSGMFVSVKLFHPAAVSPQGIERYQAFLRRLKQQQLSHILPILSADKTDDGVFYTISPIIDAVSLKEHMKRVTISPKAAIALALRIARALQELHNCDIWHLNLKPSNIFIENDGEIVLSDAGLNMLSSLHLLATDYLPVESVNYFSPEILKGEKADNRSDFWFFGVFLYETIGSKFPFASESRKKLYHQIAYENPAPIDVPAGLQIQLHEFFHRTLSKNPAERFRGIDEVIQSLSKLLETDLSQDEPTAKIHFDTISTTAQPIEQSDKLVIAQPRATSQLSTNGKLQAEPSQQQQRSELLDFYLKTGYKHLNLHTTNDLRISKTCFRKVLDLDPENARAHAGMAMVLCHLGSYGTYSPKQIFPRALQHAYQALAQQPDLPEGLLSLGNILAVYEWDWQNAQLCFQQGLKKNPQLSAGWHWLGMHLQLPLGDVNGALISLRKSSQLNPESLLIKSDIMRVHLLAGEPEQALTLGKQILSNYPDAPLPRLLFARALNDTQNTDYALKHYQKALDKLRSHSTAMGLFAYTAATIGRKDIAMKTLYHLRENVHKQYVSALDIAVICMGLNDKELALKWLENALKERSYGVFYIALDPIFKPLHQSAQFWELVKKLRLPIKTQKAEQTESTALPTDQIKTT